MHKYNAIFLSHIKTNKILPSEITWVDLEGSMLSEVCQTEKAKYHMISLTCESLKQNKQTNKQYRNELIDAENILMVARWEGSWGKGEKRMRLGSTNCQL